MLIIDDTDDFVCHDTIYEYNLSLRNFAERKFCLKDHCVQIVSFTIEKMMVVLKRGEDGELRVFAQHDDRFHCVESIQKDVTLEDYDCDYYVIDLNQFDFILNDYWYTGNRKPNVHRVIDYEFLTCYDYKQKIGEHYVNVFNDKLDLHTTISHRFVVNKDLFVFGKNVNHMLIPLTEKDKKMCDVYHFKY